jgi:nickel-dependent lactate racemase
MRTLDRILGAVILAGVFALACVDALGGCTPVGSGVVKTAEQASLEVRLGAVIEARKAYSAAEDIVADGVRGGVISHAAGEAIRLDLRAARKSIDLAETLATSGSGAEFDANLAEAWKAMEKAGGRKKVVGSQ